MFWLCALSSALSKSVQRRKILFSTEAIPDFNALPLQARLGLFFSFLPALCPFCLNFHQREARCFSAGKDGYFVSEGFSRQLPVATAGHSWPNRAGLGLCWCCFPAGSQNRTQGHTGACLVSPLFLRASLLWQGCQISFQLVIHRLLDRTDGGRCAPRRTWYAPWWVLHR